MNSNEGTMTATHEHSIKVCNELFHAELGAVEIYGQAIDRYAGSPVTDDLRRIRLDHSRSVRLLAEKVREMGGEPTNDSKALGLFAREVQGAAVLFGRNSAIKALHRREEACRTDYQIALLDDDVTADCKLIIRETLLSPVIEHLTALERLEHAA